MIPDGLTKSDFMRAAAYIDKHGIPARRDSVRYEVDIDGKRYPPKLIISRAVWFATGKELPPGPFKPIEANKSLSRYYDVFDRHEAKQSIVDEDEESSFQEGRAVYKRHRKLERDTEIPKRAKTKRLFETGKLACDVCGFDFHQVFGKRGYGFIEAHHTVPVSQISGKFRTRIDHFALVCSNCHRMLHRSPLLTVDQLKRILATKS